MNKSRLFGFLIFLLILAIAIILRLPGIIYNNFPFTYDHGLTFLEVRDMVFLHKLRLVGPEGGIKGIFFGPTWYYLLAIPFFLLRGDPRSGALLSMLINVLCIPVAWTIGNRISRKTGLFLALFFTASAIMIATSTYAFVVDTFLLINLLAIWLLIWKNKLRIYLLVLLASLSFHFEPVVAFGFNLAVFYILFPEIKKARFTNKLLILFIWIVPFIPQILFDFRHNFLQTTSVITALSKSGKDLGETLPLWKRFIDRPKVLFDQYFSVIGRGQFWLAIIFMVFITRGVKQSFNTSNKTLKSLARYCLLLFIIPFLYYVFLFPPVLKGWYYTSFIVIFFVFLALGLSLDFKNKLSLYLSYLSVIAFLFINIEPTNSYRSFKNNYPSSDPSGVKNELAAIAWIYQDARNSPFMVYTYTPAVYDYPYQYLFWWYGRNNHLSFPRDFGYKPKTIDYVPHKSSYVPPPQVNDSYPTYIIIHSYSASTQFWPLEEFMRPYQNIPLVEEKILAGGIKVQKRVKIML